MIYTKDIVAPAVAESRSYSETIRNLGMVVTGGTQTHIRQLIVKYGLDVSHFDGGKAKRATVAFEKRKSWQEILIKYPEGSARVGSDYLTRSLVESGRERCCEKCGNVGRWQDGPLVLHVDHIDQDPTNNLPENLAFLCPNCHSQKPVKKKVASKWKCETCGVRVSSGSKQCHSCYVEHRRFTPQKKPITKEDLAAAVWEMPLNELAEKLGVHKCTIWNWIREYDIPSPSKGFWAIKKQKGTKPSFVKLDKIGVDSLIADITDYGLCATSIKLATTDSTVKQYLESKGYRVVGRKGRHGKSVVVKV